jgi:hypothetical protein
MVIYAVTPIIEEKAARITPGRDSLFCLHNYIQLVSSGFYSNYAGARADIWWTKPYVIR